MFAKTSLFVIAAIALLPLNGCTTACVLKHGMPNEEEEFKDIKVSKGVYEIILPYTDLLKCVEYRVPPGPLAENRAIRLCPRGFALLQEGVLRASSGPTPQELVWRVQCTE